MCSLRIISAKNSSQFYFYGGGIKNRGFNKEREIIINNYGALLPLLIIIARIHVENCLSDTLNASTKCALGAFTVSDVNDGKNERGRRTSAFFLSPRINNNIIIIIPTSAALLIAARHCILMFVRGGGAARFKEGTAAVDFRALPPPKFY